MNSETPRVGFDIKPSGDVVLGNPPALAQLTVPYDQLQSIAQNARSLRESYQQSLSTPINQTEEDAAFAIKVAAALNQLGLYGFPEDIHEAIRERLQLDHPSASKDQENTS